MMDRDIVRERLLARRAELLEADQSSAGERSPVTLDQQSVGRLSRIDAMQAQAMALAGERRRAAERGRIESALKRLDEGEFGACVTCGEAIAEARLEHDPSVAECIGCASNSVNR